MGTVMAVCVSEKKGTPKKNIGSCEFLENYGLRGDAHAGNWHRQVSLLSYEDVREFEKRGKMKMTDGIFGENLLLSGINLPRLEVGTELRCGDALLRITQIGKECHSHCKIYEHVGFCIMPKKGIFAEVLKGGFVKVGDECEVISVIGKSDAEDADLRKKNILSETASGFSYRAGIIIASDKGSKGEREDLSGPAAREELVKAGYEVVSCSVLPDDENLLFSEMVRLSDELKLDLIVTSGGTGFSERDVTPEATMRAATKNAPGIAEAIRAESLKITPRAMLSRGASVIRNKTLIVNLPGSPKAVRECLSFILPTLSHGLGILLGRDGECARK